MGNRLSKIVTRSGDDGFTMIGDGSRLPKNDIRIQCLGEVDELNSMLGLVLTQLKDSNLSQALLQIQHDLFDLGAELSQPRKRLLTEVYVLYLDQAAELYNADLPALKEFILPGGNTTQAYLHLARTMARRLERSCVSLNQQQAMNPHSLCYLNRLSDLLFIFTRYISQQNGYQEVQWQSEYSRHS